MHFRHHLRKENSGLFHTSIEWIEEEERQGHTVSIEEPSTGALLYGDPSPPDMHVIHSQMHPKNYHDGICKIMIMHGEPLGSVGNQVSMRAIVDLASLCEAFICMRAEEASTWSAIKRTYVVPKGIDLTRFRVQDPAPKKLEGNPAILYYENWRGQRNPLYVCLAVQQLQRMLPEARLHLYNCPGGKMAETFDKLIAHARWYTFVKSLKRQEPDVVTLLNRADIVVSGLYPLYARGIEAFGCGKPFIGPGYRVGAYPFTCDLEPTSMAGAIERAWAARESFHPREWAKTYHDVSETVRQWVDIAKRYL